MHDKWELKMLASICFVEGTYDETKWKKSLVKAGITTVIVSDGKGIMVIDESIEEEPCRLLVMTEMQRE